MYTHYSNEWMNERNDVWRTRTKWLTTRTFVLKLSDYNNNKQLRHIYAGVKTISSRLPIPLLNSPPKKKYNSRSSTISTWVYWWLRTKRTWMRTWPGWQEARITCVQHLYTFMTVLESHHNRNITFERKKVHIQKYFFYHKASGGIRRKVMSRYFLWMNIQTDGQVKRKFLFFYANDNWS